jgi:CspA family cold shock protein
MATAVEETMSTTEKVESLSERYNGRVKWFNSKSGFGFVTIIEGNLMEEDVFVHHSAINVKERLYKYLMQGEYVSVKVAMSDTGKHKYNVVSVCGISAGKLMCESRVEGVKKSGDVGV